MVQYVPNLFKFTLKLIKNFPTSFRIIANSNLSQHFMLQKTFEIQLEKPHSHLLHIEIGQSHLLLNSFNANNQPARQFEFYNYDPQQDWSSVWTSVQEQSQLIASQEDASQGESSSEKLPGLSFENIKISWENQWVQSIPAKFYTEALKPAYFQLNKASLNTPEDPAPKELSCTAGAYVFPFAVPAAAYMAIQETFPQAIHQHKYAGIVRQIGTFHDHYPLKVLLVFYQDHFILCAFKENRLQLINTHYFVHGTGIIYHLLNAIRHSGTALTDTCVYLSGLIDGDSALYREIYKFVPVIDVDQAPQASFLTADPDYPSHFFVPFYKYI